MSDLASLEARVAALEGNHGLDDDAALFLPAGDADAFWLLFGMVLVFFMQAGFAMLEVGSVQLKNTKNILIKNVFDASIAAIMWWFFGYGIAFGTDEFGDDGSNGFIGTSQFFYVDGAAASPGGKTYGKAFWLFQWAFAGAAATIVSGAVAERCKFGAYIVYSVVITGFIYPVSVHMGWSGAGKLSPWRGNRLVGDCGVIDFAGSGVVHMTGGVAALVGAALIGPRRNWKQGLPQQSVVYQTLGTLILWVGWYGFNGVSTLAITGYGGLASHVMMTTTIAAATGCLATTALGYAVDGVIDTGYANNGILAGLVSITAPCPVVSLWGALIIGAVAAPVYLGSSKLLVKLGVDDVVDAELDEELRRPEVDGRGDRADDERAPERHDGAGRRDGHEAREDAVVRVARVDDAVDGVAQGRRREAARRGRDRRRHHDVAREAAVASDRERRDAVEAVPADPEDERAQGLVDDGLLGQALLPVAARADERGADERRDAAGHVDDAAAREVDDAAVADEAVAAPGRELARAGPAHVDGHGVDEARDDDGVDDVRAELAALRDRAGDDGRRGAGEGPLEEPERLAVGLAAGRRRRAVDVEELRRADEAVRAVVAELVRAERDAVAEEPPHDGGDGRVEDVLDEDVLRVLELHGPDLEHREARLHEEDEDHAEEEPEGVGVPGGEEERGVVVEAVVALEGGDASFQGGEIRHGVL
mmetsp:Transcript_4171/g.13191  ORF Transcript_4171/g.13191 Transcript_4171/m.13191 type:complete len:706 (+) Transcript_4171:117-2234(+)